MIVKYNHQMKREKLTTPGTITAPSTVILTSSVETPGGATGGEDVQPRSLTLVGNHLTFLELVVIGEDPVGRHETASKRVTVLF